MSPPVVDRTPHWAPLNDRCRNPSLILGWTLCNLTSGLACRRSGVRRGGVCYNTGAPALFTAMSTQSLADCITRLTAAVEGNGAPESGGRDRAGLPAGGECRSAATAPTAQRQLRPALLAGRVGDHAASVPCRHDRKSLQYPPAADAGPLRGPAPALGYRRVYNLAWWRDACPRFLTDPRIRANAQSRSGQAPRLESDAVVHQANGPKGSEILLKRVHHVQGGPEPDTHHGGGVPPARMWQLPSRNCTSRVLYNCSPSPNLSFRSVPQQLKDHIVVRYQE